MTELYNLSHFAWAVLEQLAANPVVDGDVVAKSGRNELIAAGLARRAVYNGIPLNELTGEGRAVAARFYNPGRPRYYS